MSSRSAPTGRKAASPPPPRSAAAVAPPPIPGACRATRPDDKGLQMTWSIIARDPATGQFGIAVATRFFAVGARVPYIAADLGAVATQAFVNPYYGIDALKLLREGLNADDVLAALLATDDGRESR